MVSQLLHLHRGAILATVRQRVCDRGCPTSQGI